MVTGLQILGNFPCSIGELVLYCIYRLMWINTQILHSDSNFQIVGASAANKYGGRRVLCFAVLLWSTSTIVTPFVAWYLPAVICARVILGLGEGLGKCLKLHYSICNYKGSSCMVGILVMLSTQLLSHSAVIFGGTIVLW